MALTLQEAKKLAFLEMASHFETWDEATQDKVLNVMGEYEVLSSVEREGINRGLEQIKNRDIVSHETIEKWFKAHI